LLLDNLVKGKLLLFRPTFEVMLALNVNLVKISETLRFIIASKRADLLNALL
jgi:hypothetical protein